MAKSLLFESVPCPRCGGSGHYSYCSMYGSVCFKCHGDGNILTKRGFAAQCFLNDLRSIPLEDFKPGDLMLCMGLGSSKFAKVLSVSLLSGKEAGYINDPDLECVKVECEGGVYIGFKGKSKERKGFSKIDKAAQVAKALAFQASLGKNGKPLKVKEPA